MSSILPAVIPATVGRRILFGEERPHRAWTPAFAAVKVWENWRVTA